MGTLKFGLKMLRKDASKSIAFTITEFFALMTSFLFFNIIENEQLRDNTLTTSGTSMRDVSVPIASMLALIIIIFSCYMLINANNLYMSHKTTDIAIMEMSGSTFMGATGYLFIQAVIMTIVALPFGMIGGTLGAWASNRYMYAYLNITSNPMYIPFNAYRDTLLLAIMMIGIMLMLDAGYIHRHDLQFLLSQEKNNDLSVASMYHVHDLVYIILAIGGVILIFTTPFSEGQYTFPCVVGAIGITGCLNQVIPNLIQTLKGRLWIARKIKLISMSNLAFSLRRSSMLILIYGLTTITMISLMVTQRSNPREYVSSIIAYIVITAMMAVSIMYKYLAEATSRRIFFFNLFKLGYVVKQIKKIVLLEVMCYFGLLIISPLFYVIPLLILFVTHGAVTKLFATVVLLSAILPSAVMGIVTYISYQRIVLKKIKESMVHE